MCVCLFLLYLFIYVCVGLFIYLYKWFELLAANFLTNFKVLWEQPFIYFAIRTYLELIKMMLTST